MLGGNSHGQKKKKGGRGLTGSKEDEGVGQILVAIMNPKLPVNKGRNGRGVMILGEENKGVGHLK